MIDKELLRLAAKAATKAAQPTPPEPRTNQQDYAAVCDTYFENYWSLTPAALLVKVVSPPLSARITPASPWQPIETAPKAVEVLVSGRGEWDAKVMVRDVAMLIDGEWEGSYRGLPWTPTHWTTLPLPPEVPNE